MNDLDIRQMVLKIMNKAIEKTENTKADVFVDFQGHVKTLDIHVHINGWKRKEEQTSDDVVIYKDVSFKHEPKESVIEKLQDMYNLICSL